MKSLVSRMLPKFHRLQRTTRRALSAGFAVALSATAFAGLVVNENSTWPADPRFATFASNAGTIDNERDIRFNRNMGQTFQLANPLKLDKIYIDYEEGVPAKEITVRLFSVANVSAGTLIDPNNAAFAGTVYFSFVYTTTEAINTFDGGNNPLAVMEFDLTDADEVTLPATTGTAGYCFQILRTGAGSTSDVTEERAFKWHWNDGENLYATGRGYAINGGTLDGSDDFTLAIDGPDTIAPTIVDVLGNAGLDRMTVIFSEGVEAASAGNLANYSVTGLTLSAPELLSPTMVRFTTSAQTAGASYTLIVNNVNDDATPANTIAAGSQLAFNALQVSTGFLTAEFFREILPRDINIGALLSWPAFIANNPDEVRNLPTFSTPANYGEDYGARVTGVLIPKETGNYYFFIRSDDASSLYINLTGASIPDPAVTSPIADETDCCDAFMEPETGDLATTGLPIALTQGQRYGVLYLLKEGGGGDFGQVAWRKEGDTTPAASLQPISGEYFETYIDATGATVTITTHPAPATGTEGRSTNFTVQATSSLGANSIGYQWLKNGVAIPGATGPTYTLSPIPGTDDGAKFSVRVRVPGTEITSNEATLTVIQDETAPTAVSAKALADRLSATIIFSEGLDPSTATNVSMYSISPTITISEANLLNPTTVRLVTSELTVGTEYTVTINGIKDYAGNSIAANTEVKFTAIGPLLQGDNGYVIWEAEGYDRLLGTRWVFNPTAGQPSGTGSMQNPQGTGANEYNDHLEYDVLFTKTGRHLIWVRGGADQADAGGADSVWLHVYPAGSQPTRPSGAIDRTLSNDAGLTGFSAGLPAGAFVWGRNAQSGISPMDFDIPTPGIYTIGIGTREDGAFVDKFVITQNPTYTPTGLGPPTTPRQGEPAPTPSTVTISQQPTNRVVLENLTATFTVVATSTDPLIAYQWQRKVGETWQDIAGATAATLTINPASLDWNGAVVRVRISVTGASATSNEATLTILQDTVLPTVLVARGRSDLGTVTIIYSEAMDQPTALDPANYSASPLVLSDPVFLADRAVRFTTTLQTLGTEYTLTINNVRDLAQNRIANNTQVKFFGVGPLQQRDDGYIVWEAEDYDRALGTWREDQTAFVTSGGLAMRVISGGEFTDHLEFDINFTQTGTHTLYTRARADNGNSDSMWLHVYPQGSQPVRPANRLTGNQASITIGNGAAVDFAWRSDAQEGPDPMTFDIPSIGVYTIGIGRRENGAYLDKLLIRANNTFVPTGLGPAETPRQGEPTIPADLAFTLQPTNVTVLENRSAKFVVGISTSDAFLVVQWQQKVPGGTFEDIIGATRTNLVIDPVLATMSGTVYRAKVTVTGREEFSNEATLTVNQDAAPPVAESTGAFNGGTIVGVRFNEELNPAALGSYSVNGTAVPAADVTLHLGKYVRLSLPGQMFSPFSVTVSGVQDLEGNAMAAPVVLQGQLSDLLSQDLGQPGTDPVEFGTTFTWGTGYYVAGGGSDIWTTNDHGYFVYKQFTGSFDMRVRVDDLVGGDEFGKAMIMARESLDAGSRNQGVLVTKNGPYIPPTTGGVDVYNVQWRDTTDGTSASTPAANRITPTVFPSWIRLVRETATTNKLDSYVSYDGQTWILADTHTTAGVTLPETLYLGMAVTSHDNAAGFPRAEVAYEGFAITPFGSGTDPNLRITRDASAITIRWDAGTLVSSATVNGTYNPVNNATSPYVVPTGETAQFYQVRLQ